MHKYTCAIDAPIHTQDTYKYICTRAHSHVQKKITDALLHGCASENLTQTPTSQRPPAPPPQSCRALTLTCNAHPFRSQESEDLEKQNAALRKEIKQLTEEVKYFTSVLSSHEPLCSVLAPGAPSPPEVVYSAHAFHQPHVSSPRFQP